MTANTNNTEAPAAGADGTAEASPEVTPPNNPEGADNAAEAIGDSGKRALQKEREARREAERRAAEAEGETKALKAAELRRDVAAEKGLTAAQARFLEGEDREALEQSADDLLEAFPAKGSGIRRSPLEALRTGATGETDARGMGDVADDVMRNW